MKMIYTDKYGLLPWLWAFLGISAFATAIYSTETWRVILGVIAGIVGFILAGKEVWRRRRAEQSGEDPTILRIVEKNADNQ